MGDDVTAIEMWVRAAVDEADLVVTAGGVSVGRHDLVREVLGRLGHVLIGRVAMRPGKPVCVATVGGIPVLGLPGNPAAAAVAHHALVAPALRKLAGRSPAHDAVEVPLDVDVEGDPHRTSYCRVRLRSNGEIVAVPLPRQGSGMIATFLEADGFAVVPPGGLPRGAIVRVERVAG